MPERVVVRVPATVANVGSGFDCVGFALAWHNEVRFERADSGLTITATGPGTDRLAKDTSNLVVRSFAALAGEVPPLRIHEMVAIPSGRGFGSSAAAVVAGLVGARALTGSSHSDDDLLRLATELEGHPDNVAPCVLGGVTVSAEGRTIRLSPPENVVPLACVAPTRMSTELARAALAADVTRSTAVASVGRAAMLVAALATGDADALLGVTDDELHQPPRFELMPDSGDLVRGLRRKGIAAFLSGAGPSVSALVPAEHAQAALAIARELAPGSWDVRLEAFDVAGAAVVDAR